MILFDTLVRAVFSTGVAFLVLTGESSARAQSGLPDAGTSAGPDAGSAESEPDASARPDNAGPALEPDVAPPQDPTPQEAQPEALPPLPDEALSAPGPLPVSDQESPERRALSHEIDLTTLAWPGNIPEGVDPVWFELEYKPRLAGTLFGSVSGVAEILIRAAEARRSAASNGEFRPNEDRQMFVPKEAFLAFNGDLDVAVGWQILNWARSDGLRPLDVFQVHDLTDRLRPETLGAPAVTVGYGRNEWAFELVWLPASPIDHFAENPANIWSILPRVAAPARLDRSAEPATDLENGEGGVRASWNGQAWDLAVMSARTRDRTPSFLNVRRDESTVVLQPEYRRHWMVGASAVRALGAFILRAEGLWARYDHQPLPFLRNGIRGVAGIETRGAVGDQDRCSLILQYAIDTTAADGIQQHPDRVSSPFRLYRHAVTAAGLATWRERYDVELRFFEDLKRFGLVSSLKLKYRPRDGLAVWVAGDVIAGGKDTWLERMSAGDRVLVGLEIHAN